MALHRPWGWTDRAETWHMWRGLALFRNATTTPATDERWRMARYEDSSDDKQLTASAYSGLAVVSGLLFGFALSAFTNLLPKNAAASTPLLNMFLLLTSVIIALSGFGTFVLSLQHYHITRMAVISPSDVDDFLDDTYRFRNLARCATWISMILVMPATGLLALDRLPIEYSALMMSLLGTGAVTMLAVSLCQQKAFVLAVEPRGSNSA